MTNLPPAASWPAPVPRTSTRTTHPLARVLVTILLCAEAGLVALVVGFVALVTATGCLLDCEGADGDLGRGLVLAVLALGILALGPALSVVMWRTARSSRALGVWAGLALLPLGVYALGGSGLLG